MKECQNWTYGTFQVFRNSRTLVWSACKGLSANRTIWAENSIRMIYVARIRCSRNSSLRVSSRVINTAFLVWGIFHCKGVQCSKFIGKSNWRPKCVETFPFTLCIKLFIRSAFGIHFMCRRFIICLFCYSLCCMFFCSQFTVVLHTLVIHINEASILPCICRRGFTKARDITNCPPSKFDSGTPWTRTRNAGMLTIIYIVCVCVCAYVEKIRVWLKPNKNNGHFPWRSMYICDNIWSRCP